MLDKVISAAIAAAIIGGIKYLVDKKRLTVKQPIYVAFRCSKCGKLNYYKHIMKTDGSSSQFGIGDLPAEECQECKNTESWMVPTYPILKKLAFYALIISLVGLALLICIRRDQNLANVRLILIMISTCLLYAAIILVVLRWILRIIMKTKIKKAAASLGEENGPIVATDYTEYLQLIEKRFGLDDDTRKQISKTINGQSV
ncbi:MAG: hypothetical protein K6A77_09520 [Clostridiales bacterium]|nr:hypothetical protein [Clostridiales bacterium]